MDAEPQRKGDQNWREMFLRIYLLSKERDEREKRRMVEQAELEGKRWCRGHRLNMLPSMPVSVISWRYPFVERRDGNQVDKELMGKEELRPEL